MTRKKEIIELQFRQALTRSAIKQVQKEKRRQLEEGEKVDIPETLAVVSPERAKKIAALDDENNHIALLPPDHMENLDRVHSAPETPKLNRLHSLPDSPTVRTSSRKQSIPSSPTAKSPGVQPYPGT